MTKKDYELIASAIWRSGMALSVKDNNRVKQQARHKMQCLIAIDIATGLALDNPRFDRKRFMEACGLSEV